jgi:hypothetical protein
MHVRQLRCIGEDRPGSLSCDDGFPGRTIRQRKRSDPRYSGENVEAVIRAGIHRIFPPISHRIRPSPGGKSQEYFRSLPFQTRVPGNRKETSGSYQANEEFYPSYSRIGSSEHVPRHSRQFLHPEPIYHDSTRFRADSRLRFRYSVLTTGYGSYPCRSNFFMRRELDD